MTKCTDRLLSRGHHSVMAMLLYCEWKSGLSTISGHLLHCMPTITCPRTRVIKIPDNIPRPADPCVQGLHTQEPALIPAVSWRSCSFTRAGHSSKGAGSFHIHRKTMEELGILALLGIRERPNLAQNLVTH